MARILVTGASGFIGKHLVPKLRDNHHDVIEANSRSGDIADEGTWQSFPQVDVVIHLAGRTFVPDSWLDSAGFLKTNFLGTIAALEYCKNNDARLVYLSSYLYGNPEKLPISESAPLYANNPYALSKKLTEEACQFYSDSFGVKITVLRPFNVYGPGQSELFLIPSIIDQTSLGDVIRVKDLEPKRDYVYIDDLVSAIIKAIGLYQGFSVFNIGTGLSYSVAELIGLIQEIKGSKLTCISSEERRPDEILDCRADIAQATRCLGWKPETDLKSGLRAVIEKLSFPGFI